MKIKTFSILLLLLTIFISCVRLKTKDNLNDSLGEESKKNIKNEIINLDKNKFRIEIFYDGFEVYYQNKLVAKNDIDKFDLFLKNHKDELSKYKFYILGDKNIPFKKIEIVFNHLRKYELLNFELIAK